MSPFQGSAAPTYARRANNVSVLSLS